MLRSEIGFCKGSSVILKYRISGYFILYGILKAKKYLTGNVFNNKYLSKEDNDIKSIIYITIDYNKTSSWS